MARALVSARFAPHIHPDFRTLTRVVSRPIVAGVAKTVNCGAYTRFKAAFVVGDRIPEQADRSKFLELAPDLVVEVISPGDRIRYVNDKVMEYLDAGVRLVWLIDPVRETVTVYSADRTARILTTADNLDGGDVLPGFRVPVAEIFE